MKQQLDNTDGGGGRIAECEDPVEATGVAGGRLTVKRDAAGTRS